jgi:hypothetical protein
LHSVVASFLLRFTSSRALLGFQGLFRKHIWGITEKMAWPCKNPARKTENGFEPHATVLQAQEGDVCPCSVTRQSP